MNVILSTDSERVELVIHKRLMLHTRAILYLVSGFFLGSGAPLAWSFIRLVLFREPALSPWAQVLSDLTRNSQNMALYSYMGFGTAMVLGTLGFIVGRGIDQLRERGEELGRLNGQIDSQKELFENRYKVLDNNIKNFHQISSRIQRSINGREVLQLCAEGLHDILGYERINILMASDDRRTLHFVTATGTKDFDPKGVTIPLDSRSGVIHKCFVDRKLYYIDDIGRYPYEFHLQPPYDSIRPLRSRSFVICPIVVKGEAVGLFGIDNRFSHRSLNDTDVDTIRLFADQAASALTKIDLIGAIDTLTVELENSFAGLLKNRTEYTVTLERLQQAVRTVAEGTAHIVTAAGSVMTSVDDTGSEVAGISSAVDQAAHNLDDLSRTIATSASAVEEINVSIRTVERLTEESHERSSQVKVQADQGRTVAAEAIGTLDELHRAVELSYKGITTLSENSGRIDGIITVINEVTKRTNLLALNASIIAAQAGDQGAGFGVVSQEIRNLSLKTGASTGEITAIIQQLRSESRQAAEQIALTKELVHRGVASGQLMASALEMIHARSEESMAMTREIRNVTRDEVKNVQFVTKSMEEVSAMTARIADTFQEQNASLKRIVSAMEAIKGLSYDMVRSSNRQAEGGDEIGRSLESVSVMLEEMLETMEKRRVQSAQVVAELEQLRKSAK